MITMKHRFRFNPPHPYKTRLTIDELKLCNCAGCNCVLLGESMVPLLHKIPDSRLAPVHARIKGRPYCQLCTQKRAPSP